VDDYTYKGVPKWTVKLSSIDSIAGAICIESLSQVINVVTLIGLNFLVLLFVVRQFDLVHIFVFNFLMGKMVLLIVMIFVYYFLSNFVNTSTVIC